MTSPAKAKGDAFERAVAAYLLSRGLPAERRYGAGRKDDRGDIDGIPGFVIECKARRALDLAGWVDEASRERARAGAPCAVVVAKRRGHRVEDAYCVVTLDTFATIVTEHLHTKHRAESEAP